MSNSLAVSSKRLIGKAGALVVGICQDQVNLAYTECGQKKGSVPDFAKAERANCGQKMAPE